MKRRCLEPGCNQISDRTRCAMHRSEQGRKWRQANPTHREDHKRARAALAVEVASGNATCSRCSKPVRPGDAWEADRRPDSIGGGVTVNGNVYRVSCFYCNRAAGGRHEP